MPSSLASLLRPEVSIETGLATISTLMEAYVATLFLKVSVTGLVTKNSGVRAESLLPDFVAE